MRRRLIRLGALVAALGAALVAWSAASARLFERIPVAVPIVVSNAYVERTDHLRRDETLSHMFARHNVEGIELQQLLEVARADGLNPRRITPNQLFELRYVVGQDSPNRLRLRISQDAFLRLDRTAAGEWESTLDEVQWTVLRERISGRITSSFNNSIHEAIADSTLSAGQRAALITNVAEDVYGWLIDFLRDNRPGDRFNILYERLFSSEGDVRYGRLLAASIETGGKPSTAYVMSDDQNRNVYYDAEGRSLRRAFLRSPVRLFSRISGSFGRRYHPILGRYRAHLGTDYAAYSGRPVRATADGVVRRAGRWGGYGNVVTLRHPKAIETRYAHMRRVDRGIRPGVRVSQGQTIGYVGMTGLATGPHVHYEFLKNSRQVDFRRVDLGDGEPISDELRPEFERTKELYNQLMFAGASAAPVAASH